MKLVKMAIPRQRLLATETRTLRMRKMLAQHLNHRRLKHRKLWQRRCSPRPLREPCTTLSTCRSAPGAGNVYLAVAATVNTDGLWGATVSLELPYMFLTEHGFHTSRAEADEALEKAGEQFRHCMTNLAWPWTPGSVNAVNGFVSWSYGACFRPLRTQPCLLKSGLLSLGSFGSTKASIVKMPLSRLRSIVWPVAL